MRVLITGAAGYVGSILIKALESIDGIDEIVGVDLQPRPGRLAASTKVAWIQAMSRPMTGRPPRVTIA
jgi:nucleoside-diphosphate-sugar epimerase